MVGKTAGMTPEEIAEVQKTWKLVMDNVADHSVNLLIKYLFSSNTEDCYFIVYAFNYYFQNQRSIK